MARRLLAFYADAVLKHTFTILRQNPLTFTLPPPYGLRTVRSPSRRLAVRFVDSTLTYAYAARTIHLRFCSSNSLHSFASYPHTPGTPRFGHRAFNLSSFASRSVLIVGMIRCSRKCNASVFACGTAIPTARSGSTIVRSSSRCKTLVDVAHWL